MKPQHLRPIGIACFAVCAICLFVAFERYEANASNVDAMKKMTQALPFGDDSPFGNIQPATPAATKYALFVALLSGAGGIFCFACSGKPKSDSEPVRSS